MAEYRIGESREDVGEGRDHMDLTEACCSLSPSSCVQAPIYTHWRTRKIIVYGLGIIIFLLMHLVYTVFSAIDVASRTRFLFSIKHYRLVNRGLQVVYFIYLNVTLQLYKLRSTLSTSLTSSLVIAPSSCVFSIIVSTTFFANTV